MLKFRYLHGSVKLASRIIYFSSSRLGDNFLQNILLHINSCFDCAKLWATIAFIFFFFVPVVYEL